MLEGDGSRSDPVVERPSSWARGLAGTLIQDHERHSVQGEACNLALLRGSKLSKVRGIGGEAFLFWVGVSEAGRVSCFNGLGHPWGREA